MDAYIAITDYDWFRFLRDRPAPDEVNFWRPGEEARAFRALPPGGLFLFKLRKRFGGAIVGGGWFLHFSRFPSGLVWDAFGERNGTASYDELRTRLARLRHRPIGVIDEEVGCIILTRPFFLQEGDWIDPPANWPPNVVGGKTYSLESEYGAQLLAQLQGRWASRGPTQAERAPVAFTESVVRRRLGQGSFELVVRDAYERRCAITHERVLPVLQAAHILPVIAGGPHQLANGLLLRSDIHTLFDKGYVTVTPDGTFHVSRRVHDEFNNGDDYYKLDGRPLWLPRRADDRPSAEFLEWHRREVFKDAA
jgi:putative restriction endonuclease